MLIQMVALVVKLGVGLGLSERRWPALRPLPLPLEL